MFNFKVFVLAFVLAVVLLGSSMVDAAAQPQSGLGRKCSGELDKAAADLFQGASQSTLGGLCSSTLQTFTLVRDPPDGGLRLDLEALPEVGRAQFYGLAAYYNRAQAFRSRHGNVSSLKSLDPGKFSAGDWVVLSGRYDALAFRTRDANVSFTENELVFLPVRGKSLTVEAVMAPKRELADIHNGLGNVTYAHLWDWMAGLARIIEHAVRAIHDMTNLGWGWTIFAFAVAMKILLLPASLMTMRFQGQVNRHQSALAPQVAEIKAKFKGEEAHNRVMAAHKALGISPFYTLKPLIGSAINIPFLVAIFAALGEMPQLAGVEFFWIDDLSLPDVVATTGFVIPGFGDRISLLPMIMTAVTVLSTLVFHDPNTRENVLKRQRRNLYLMAGGFFILFYPFPAAMVYYWMLNNIFQAIQQQLVKP